MVPEGRGVFTRMTINENLQIGAYIRKDKAEIASGMERVFVTISRLRAQAPAGRGYVMESGLRAMLATSSNCAAVRACGQHVWATHETMAVIDRPTARY